MLLILFSLLPVIFVSFWILKKKKVENIESVPSLDGKLFFSFIYKLNETIWIRSFLTILISGILILTDRYFSRQCNSFLCGFELMPIYLIILVAIIIILVKLISSISLFYFPAQKQIINSKYVKWTIFIMVIVYFIYEYILRRFINL